MRFKASPIRRQCFQAVIHRESPTEAGHSSGEINAWTIKALFVLGAPTGGISTVAWFVFVTERLLASGSLSLIDNMKTANVSQIAGA